MTDAERQDAERQRAHVKRLVEKAGGWPWHYEAHVHEPDREVVFHLPAGASARGAGSALQKLQALLEPKDIEILTGAYDCSPECLDRRPKLRTVNKTPLQLAQQRVCTYVTFIDVTWPWER
jgi:hypothetical protein